MLIDFPTLTILDDDDAATIEELIERSYGNERWMSDRAKDFVRSVRRHYIRTRRLTPRQVQGLRNVINYATKAKWQGR